MKNKYWILIFGAIFALCLVLALLPGNDTPARTAQITSGGRIIRTVDLSQDAEFTVEVEGAALLGFGSGDPKPAYNYTGNITRTFRGRAMAIVRGAGTVTVRCDTCSAVLSVN